MKKVLIVLTVMFSFAAMADQCAVLSGDQAQKGLKLIQSEKTVVKYCADCGDRYAEVVPVSDLNAKVFGLSGYAVGAVVQIEDLSVLAFVVDIQASFTLMIKEDVVDLAYVYTKDGNNIGHSAGCYNSSPVVLPADIKIF